MPATPATSVIHVRAWLEGDTAAQIDLQPYSSVTKMTLQLVPTKPGMFKLWAAAVDDCGNRQQTGKVRLVTVTP
jgi:hypothetical protein